MEGFKSYLLSRHLSNEKQAGFYLYWVSQFYSHCNKSPGDRVESEDIERYLKFLAKRREDWQVKQASEAIELYLFFRRKKQATQNTKIHRLIFNQAIFRPSEIFLTKNRARWDHFFLKYLKRTEKTDFGRAFPHRMFCSNKNRMLPLTTWNRFHHCYSFSGFNQ